MILLDVLDTAGEEYKASSSREGEITLNCPFCVERGHTADDRFRLGINVKLGIGHCFQCDWKSRSFTTTLKDLCRVFGLDFRSFRIGNRSKELYQVPVPEAVEEETTPIGLPDEYEVFSGSTIRAERQARKYLQRRGVTLSQIVRHNIGYAGAGNLSYRVIFPVYDEDGMCHGCAARDITGESKYKYLNTPGMKLFWNAHRPGKVAVVVEGVLDGLAVERALLGSNERGAVPIAQLGSSVTEAQFFQLRKYERIVLLPDWDVAGVTGARRLATMCHEQGFLVSVAVPSIMNGSDPGSHSEELIRDSVINALPWNQSTDFRLRMSITKVPNL